MAMVSLLLLSNERCLDHLTGAGHPERPARLGALTDGVARADLGQSLIPVVATAAPIEAVARVHDQNVVDIVERLATGGGGRIDGDTITSPASFEAARLAAGAGLDAVELLRRAQPGAPTTSGNGVERAHTAFCAVRPPGHHATPRQSMGFCLFNNVAVSARALIDSGERVLIVDYDAHHGNGTQDIFYDDPNVLFVSFHQWPQYPGTGRHDETGSGAGAGTTINLPLPAGATGDVYLRGWDEIVLPRIEAFAPTWVLLSAGFDAHRADPLTDLGLTAGDYAVLTSRVLSIAPPGRRIVFLEGGYDLAAVSETSAAVLSTIVGQQFETEAPTSGGPGHDQIDRVAAHLDAVPSVGPTT